MEWANIYAAGAQVSLVSDLLRMTSFTLDAIIYGFIPSVYNAIQYLYDISSLIDSSELLSTTKKSIYSLIAIYMFFKLAFSLLGMLVDTSMIDNKEKGAGKIVANVMVCLVLIVAVPYIFQYAKLAQTKIMENQLIEKAIYGKDFNSEGDYTLGNRLELAAWSIFLQPTTDSGLAVDAYNAIFEQVNGKASNFRWLELYATLNFTTGVPVFRAILKIIPGVNGILNMFGAGTHYQLSYVYIISNALGIYLLWTMIKMCIDVAYRSLKLLALEILSPIAIISYIDPKSSKDGVFAKWLKECVKTYTSLFVRIFVFAFVSLLLSELNVTSMATISGTFTMTPFVRLMYILAIIAFMKTAPKFIDGIFGTELSKESETKAATNILKGLGFGAATMGMGAIRGGVVAKRTDGKIFKGAMKGGWKGLMAGFESGNKNGFNMKGVIGAFTNTWSGINKEHGYEYDKQYYKDLEGMKQHIKGVNNAKQSKSFGFNSEDAYAKYAALSKEEQAKWGNARAFVANEEKLLDQKKHAAFLEYLYRERKTKAGTSYNLAYLANNKTAEELWAKNEAVKAQTDYLASQGVLSEEYATVVAYKADTGLEAQLAGYVKADAQAEFRRRMDHTSDGDKATLVAKHFTEKGNELRAKVASSGKPIEESDAAELARYEEQIRIATANEPDVDKISAAFEEVISDDFKARTSSDRMVIRHKDGTEETTSFGGLGIGLWDTATANKETDAESAKENLNTYAKGKEGAKDKRNDEMFNKAKTAHDAEHYRDKKN